MQKIETKCDICGEESETDSSVIGEIEKGQKLIKVPVQGVGKFVNKFTMHLCAKHYLEYWSNTRNWVKQQSTLDEYMDLPIAETPPSPISQT